jgi:hypothetical protein
MATFNPYNFTNTGGSGIGDITNMQQQGRNAFMQQNPTYSMGSGNDGSMANHLTSLAMNPSLQNDPAWQQQSQQLTAPGLAQTSWIGNQGFAQQNNAGNPAGYQGAGPSGYTYDAGGNVTGSPGGMGGPGLGAGGANFGGLGLGMGGTPMPKVGPQNSHTSNPYYSSLADDITRRTQHSLGQSLQGIQSNAVGVGGLGGSRQGVAQGQAISGAMDNLSGQLGAMGSGMWNADQNRDLSRYQGDQSFYTAQRGQDYQGIGLGADLMSRGLQTPWAPIQNANNVYSPYSGMGQTTNSSQQGGGWMGALGGGLGAAQFGQNMGWWK